MQTENKYQSSKKIILAGNPNVGKSTLFNAMTGLRQHTGNWSGKTVDVASGTFLYKGTEYEIIDVPGCYSLTANSEEEACAAKAITTLGADGIIIVCNAFNLERNLNLVLQIMEVTNRVIVALNFCDEAEKHGVKINIKLLSEQLGVPVVKINARKKRGIDSLFKYIEKEAFGKGFVVSYGRQLEHIIDKVKRSLKHTSFSSYDRFMALRLVENSKIFCNIYRRETGNNFEMDENVLHSCIRNQSGNEMKLEEFTSFNITKASERIIKSGVILDKNTDKYTTVADRIFTGKISGFIIMFIVLFILVLTTVKLANYPSELLSKVLFSFENKLYDYFLYVKIPKKICEALIYGGYRVLAWVVSVMLPPMAIFFPLFTILEDVGYLPRIAFNLDKCFKKCNTCGKQALTMCMGLGCNAVGVTGARIIDSPRERLISIVTNSFVPCNGKFPTLICLSVIFFSNCVNEYLSAFYVAMYIVIAIGAALFASWILSRFMLKGIPSSFSIELPSFRKPQIGQIVVRSLVNRTFLILMRAVRVAFPMGIIIWLLTNISINGHTIINYIVKIFDLPGSIMGIDGVILTAFILGFPANEIILPIIIMLYSSQTLMLAPGGYSEIMSVLNTNGWTVATAVCVITFLLMHWPCSTTLLTIKKETDKKTTALAFALPTFFGVVSCIFINLIFKVVL